MIFDDEIVSIEYVGEEETIDINVTGDRLFYANGILTHNSAVDELEFDHSHIAGGISKINSSDYVFGIFTSRPMRERGKYQIQCMKARSSTGVGQKIELDYDVETMRITDSGEDDDDNSPSASTPTALMDKIKNKSTVISSTNADISDSATFVKSSTVDVQGTKLKHLLNNLKNKND